MILNWGGIGVGDQIQILIKNLIKIFRNKLQNLLINLKLFGNKYINNWSSVYCIDNFYRNIFTNMTTNLILLKFPWNQVFIGNIVPKTDLKVTKHAPLIIQLSHKIQQQEYLVCVPTHRFHYTVNVRFKLSHKIPLEYLLL